MGDLTANFSMSEFSRTGQWGHLDIPAEHQRAIREQLAPRLQRVRDRIGRPMRITSGYRTEAYNRHIGGSKSSAHRYGLAADVDVEGMGADELAQHFIEDAEEHDDPWDQVISYPKTGGHVHVGLPRSGREPRDERRRKLPSGTYPHVVGAFV